MVLRLGLDLWAKLSRNAPTDPVEAEIVSHAVASLGCAQTRPDYRYEA
jgi:hypothetical protein